MRCRSNDRYLIYRMIGRRVEFASPYRRVKFVVTGVVEGVCRNIFDNEVELLMRGGRMFRFKEPAAIIPDGNHIVFLYGDVGRKEASDAAVFREMRAQGGGTVDDALMKTELMKIRATRFVVLAEEPRRRACRAA